MTTSKVISSVAASYSILILDHLPPTPRACSTPLQGVASRWVFQLVLLALSVYSWYRAMMEYQAIPKAGRFSAAHLRVTALESHGPGCLAGAATCGATSLGILLDGCRVLPTMTSNVTTGADGPTLTVGFDGTAEGNGYFLTVPSGVALTRWMVEASQDNAASWVLIGASVWHLDQQNTAGTMEFYPQLASDVAPGPTGELQVDYRPQWQWIVSAVVVNVNNGTMLLGAAIAALAGHWYVLKHALIFMFGFAVVQDAIAACSYFATGQFREAVARVLVVPENSIMAVIIIWFEPCVLEGILLYGIVGLLARCLMDVVNYKAGFALFVSNNLISSCFAAAVFALVCLYFRRRDVQQARALVVSDRLGYDALWAAITDEPDTSSDLVLLESIVTQVPVTVPISNNCTVLVSLSLKTDGKHSTTP